MIWSLFSDAEIECLRSIVNTNIVELLTPTLTIFDENVRLLAPASLRLGTEDRFLIIGSTTIPFTIDSEEVTLGDQLKIHTTHMPSQIPSTVTHPMMVGGCSAIDLGSHFRVTSIEIYEYETIVAVRTEAKEHRIPLTQDVQITFFSRESRPISVAAARDSIYVSSDLGFCNDRSCNLERRLILK